MKKNNRHIDKLIQDHFYKYKQILLLQGARQVGKTTLLNRIFPNAQYLFVDNDPVKENLETYDINVYKQFLNLEAEAIIIDEIHLLSDPGRAAKIIYDQLPGIKLIITGSSALNIKNKTTESLAGRKITYHIYPLTFSEYLVQNDIESSLNYKVFHNLTNTEQEILDNKVYLFNINKTLENVLLYGLYPEIISLEDKIPYLKNLAESVIFSDILELHLIDNKKTALDLLKLLAFQIGNLINYSEIAQRLNIDTRTVQRYIDIFEESYVIFRLYPFSKNKRDEIGKSPKIYFYDTGLRNALINAFEPIAIRNDTGGLFENFIVNEFIKSNNYKQTDMNLNYWRLIDGSEMDMVITKHNTTIGAEIKFSRKRYNSAFKNRYPDSLVKIVTGENFY